MSDEKFLLRRHPTLNPYISAIVMVFRRVRWDITLESWRSRRKLKQWKNRFADQKAVVVCNGPSLLKSDLSLLKNTFTFGLNKINLLFDKSDFRPSCIVAMNPYVIEQNATFYNHTTLPLFLDSAGTRHIFSRNNIIFLHTLGLPKFARDCSISVFQGFTVTFVALQLAFHMGFQEVALIGCDHDYINIGPPNNTVISGENDPNHFDPNYFAKGVKWQLPDLLNSESYYTLARDVYQQAGRKVFNATDGGKLEVFERVPLKYFLKTTIQKILH